MAIEVRAADVAIGSLTVPGRPGCGYCAAERLRGAAWTLGHSARPPTGPAKAGVPDEIVAHELRAALGDRLTESALLDHVLVVNATSRDASFHRVVPLASCPICGGAAVLRSRSTRGARGHRIRTVPAAFDALSGWVDRHTGVIASVVLDPRAESLAGRPFVATAAPPSVVSADGSMRTLPVGWGKGLTALDAVLSAVGEAIERYAASVPDSSRIVWKRARELRGARLDPGQFSLYADAQYESAHFPYVRFDPDVRHPWVRGTWLGSDRPVWVPAILAFLSLDIHPEHLFCQGTSNGLAAAADLDTAARRAAFELVERDALLSAWLTGRPGVRLVRDDSWDPRLRAVVDAIETIGATVEAYVLPTGVYGVTVMCLAFGDGRAYPGVTIGLGTDVDARVALRQAALELGQTGPFLQQMMRSGAAAIPPRAAAVMSLMDHASYYFPQRRAAAFDRLRGGGSVRLSDLPRGRSRPSLSRCAKVLDATGIRVAVVDVTPADVATGPFRVARAVSPDLQAVSFGFGMARQPVSRVRALGIDSRAPRIQPVW